MENKTLLTAKILDKTQEISDSYPQLSRHLAETPVPNLDYGQPTINQQEMQDYHDSLSTMIIHSDSTSIGDNGIISSHPRPDARRSLDADLMEFDLNKEIENIKLEGNWAAGNQSAKTLMKSEQMRVILIAMHRDNEMKMHQSNGPITLQVLEGNIQFMTWQNSITIKTGQMVTLHEKVQHNLLAKEQSIILLTMLNIANESIEDMELKEPIEKDNKTVETSENLNFPDFPTYPPKDDIYKEPKETIIPPIT